MVDQSFRWNISIVRKHTEILIKNPVVRRMMNLALIQVRVLPSVDFTTAYTSSLGIGDQRGIDKLY